MAGWPPNKTRKSSGALMQIDNIELMQNCDLPQPVRVFSGSDKVVISSMNRLLGMMGRQQDDDCFDAYERSGADENEKLELLKALRLSQTRAREAERKAASDVKERDGVYNAFWQESLQVRVYRQWVWLLELQVLKLQSQWNSPEQKELCGSCRRSKGKDCGDDTGVSWFSALVFCLGIACIGFAFGCTYLF